LLNLPSYLKTGQYRLTVFGSGASGQTLRDLSGNRLDGDANGSAGGDFTSTFNVVPPSPAGPLTTFDYASTPQKIQLKFNTDVGATLAIDDLVVTGPTGIGPSSNFNFTYDAQTFTATWTVSGFSRNQLPDGNYHAALAATSVADAAGNPMAAPFALDFFALAGDANHDRSVDFNDLVALAQNYNVVGGRTWAQADFTGDGTTDFNDLVLLAQRYNTSLPAAASTPIPVIAPPMPSLASVISQYTATAKPAPKPVSKRVATPQTSSPSTKAVAQTPTPRISAPAIASPVMTLFSTKRIAASKRPKDLFA
jgi:hypothetical protein